MLHLICGGFSGSFEAALKSILRLLMVRGSRVGGRAETKALTRKVNASSAHAFVRSPNIYLLNLYMF